MYCQRSGTSCRMTSYTGTECSMTTNTSAFWINAPYENLICTLSLKERKGILDFERERAEERAKTSWSWTFNASVKSLELQNVAFNR